ncbi:MAG: hypothetical protein ACXU82_21145 [Caulobacteraceae bacterium]
MTAILKRQVSHRLAKLVRQPGGKTVGAIEAEVEARLEPLRKACIIDAQDRVDRLMGLARDLPRPPAPDDLAPFYEPCNDIVGLAGVSNLAHAGYAALSFCRLLDGWTQGEPWSPASFDVHLDALVLLCRPDCDLGPAAKDRIVEGLDRLVRHHHRKSATPPPSRTLP